MGYNNIKDYLVITAIAGVLMGCSGESPSNEVGYLVTPWNSNVQYTCGTKISALDNDGKFDCSSFPITFYSHSKKLGFIDSIHNDGYVFPQDIIEKEAMSSIEMIRMASSY